MKVMLKACPKCHGSGRVPRMRRTIDGVIDPTDQRTEELCECGGSGKVVDTGPTSEAPVGAWADAVRMAQDYGGCCQ